MPTPRETILTALHARLDRPVGTLRVQTFITDDGITDADAKAFESRGIDLLIAE